MAAGQLREEELMLLVVNVMSAAKNVQAQRDRLLEFQLQLQQTPENPIEEVVSGLAEVCFDGLKDAAGYVNGFLERAAKNGARLAPNPTFSDERQLLDALLPAAPRAADHQEHLLPRCIDHLFEIRHKDPTGTVQAASSSMDQARTWLNRACTIVNLAMKHIELFAVAAITPFVHPKEVGRLPSAPASLTE